MRKLIILTRRHATSPGAHDDEYSAHWGRKETEPYFSFPATDNNDSIVVINAMYFRFENMVEGKDDSSQAYEKYLNCVCNLISECVGAALSASAVLCHQSGRRLEGKLVHEYIQDKLKIRSSEYSSFSPGYGKQKGLAERVVQNGTIDVEKYNVLWGQYFGNSDLNQKLDFLHACLLEGTRPGSIDKDWNANTEFGALQAAENQNEHVVALAVLRDKLLDN